MQKSIGTLVFLVMIQIFVSVMFAAGVLPLVAVASSGGIVIFLGGAVLTWTCR